MNEETRATKAIKLALIATLALVSGMALPAEGGRTEVAVGEIADISGVRDNQLAGYGLVVGLAGTGDGTQARFTVQAIANALQRMGVVVPPGLIRVRNVASVMVTADLPAFAKPGTRLDVTVSSLGDAKSLTGGTLLMTPLKGPDNQVYALAQGAVSLGGGFSAEGGGASVTKNHPTTGTIPAGALVERDSSIDLAGRGAFDLQLRRPDFATAQQIEQVMRETFGTQAAQAVDAGTVRLAVPPALADRPVEFLSAALDTRVAPRVPARVVLNERTGTVVLGGDVRVGAVSVTHGNLTVSVANRYAVSQPAPFSKRGQTVVVPEGEVVTEEEEPARLTFGEDTRVEELVDALRQVGVGPRDLIAIFQAIRAAGALHAELVVI